MRRLRVIPLDFLWALCLPLACTKPPEPEKAKDLDKIEQKADDKKTDEAKLDTLPTGPVATVSGVPVENKAFHEIYDRKVAKYGERGREIPASADRRYRKSIVERLIYHEVLKQEAEKQGVAYDEKALAERIDQQKRGIREWDKHLERRGETEESLREMYIAELREKALLEKGNKLEVTPAEVTEEYEKTKANYKADKPRVRASHILIHVGPESTGDPGQKVETPSDEQKKAWDKEALAKANEVYKQASAPGADFDELAKQFSTGSSANKGGDLGIFTEDRMVPEFSKVAFKLKPGQISKPVLTKFGYHVIKVLGKWGPGDLPQEALQDQIVDRLRQRKLHRGRRELKDQLLASYAIVDLVKPTLGPEPERRGLPPMHPEFGAGAPKDEDAAAKAGGEAKPAAGEPEGAGAEAKPAELAKGGADPAGAAK